MNTHRREFLKMSALFAASGWAAGEAFGAVETTKKDGNNEIRTPESARKGDMLYRKLGRTGEQVSLVGVGGSHIGQQATEEESIHIIRTAIDHGITFMDNSWDYNDGQSELRMGKALQDGYREKVFLMTKIDGRDKKTAAQQIDESLKRLQTDHLDLLQLHEVIRLEDPDRIFADGGAIEAVKEAKQAGKTRYLGFTGHKDPMVHLRMLDTAKTHDFRFDTVQMPINVMDANFRSFQFNVLPRLEEEGIGPLAMKTFGSPTVLQYVMKNHLASPIELLHYSMTMPVSVVITGMDSLDILNQALEAVKTFQPLSPEKMAALREKTKPEALTGKTERFKTSSHFDSTAQHPEWLGQA